MPLLADFESTTSVADLPVPTARPSAGAKPYRRPSSVCKDEARRERLLAIDVECIDNPRFDEPGFAEQLARAEREGVAEPETVRRSDLPSHLRALCAAPLLTREGERTAFLRFNWERHRAHRLQALLADGETSPRLLDEIETALERIVAARNAIVLANTRLVVSVARTFVGPGVTFDDLLAAGLPVLLRAVELFDIARGYRFSTYATWSVRNHYLRVRQRANRHRERFRTGESETLDELRTTDDAPTEDHARTAKRTVRELLVDLDDRDRTIVEARFGLNGQRSGQTFAEIGELVGLSKERVRQLTQRALDQLRQSHPELARSLGV